MKPAARIAMIFLALVAVAHLLRLVFRVEVLAGGVPVPMWLSVVAIVLFGGVAYWLWREQKGLGP